MAYDINKILSEYGENDFGFTAVDEAEYKARLQQVEKIIMPFLTNLYKTKSQPYIHWPNRGPILESQMQKILTLTRG